MNEYEMKLDKKLKQFEDEYLKLDWRGETAYNEEASMIMSDIFFFREYLSRMKKVKRFDIDIQFVSYCGNNEFISRIFEIRPWTICYHKDFIRRLKIADITKEMFNELLITWFYELYIPKIIKFGEIISHILYIKINFKDYISSYVASSSICEEIEKKWDLLEEKKEKK